MWDWNPLLLQSPSCVLNPASNARIGLSKRPNREQQQGGNHKLQNDALHETSPVETFFAKSPMKMESKRSLRQSKPKIGKDKASCPKALAI
jgi:hypothetical protein